MVLSGTRRRVLTLGFDDAPLRFARFALRVGRATATVRVAGAMRGYTHRCEPRVSITVLPLRAPEKSLTLHASAVGKLSSPASSFA